MAQGYTSWAGRASANTQSVCLLQSPWRGKDADSFRVQNPTMPLAKHPNFVSGAGDSRFRQYAHQPIGTVSGTQPQRVSASLNDTDNRGSLTGDVNDLMEVAYCDGVALQACELIYSMSR